MFPLKDNIPTSRFPILTVALILVNIAVFAWQSSYNDPDLERAGLTSGIEQTALRFGATPHRLTKPGEECRAVSAEPGGGEIVCGGEAGTNAAFAGGLQLEQAPALLTVLFSMFLHGGLLHLGGNMLFLWIFGNNIEDSMGRLRFVAFYLLAGVAALGAQVAIDPGSAIPTVGASGAIAGVLGGYALLYPRARVLTAVLIIFLFTLVEIPALIVLGIWFAMQFLPAVGQLATPELGGEGGGVAYFAHVGGFLFGLALIKLFATRNKDWAPESRLSAG